MKKLLLKSILSACLLISVGCNGGSDSKKDVVAAPVGVPPGRVSVFNSPDNFCDINPSSIVCSEYGQQCSLPPIQFTDLPTFCNAIHGLQAQSRNCGYNSLNAVIQQRCASLQPMNPGHNGNPNSPVFPTPNIPGSNQQALDVNFREFQCEFEAFRFKRKYGMDFQTGTGLIKASLLIDVRRRQEFNLRNNFLGVDIGQFGTTNLIFSPAKLNGTADTLTLSTNGLNGEIEIIKSGFAGEEVRIDAQNKSGNAMLNVSCRGIGRFKRIASVKTVSQYVCTGKSKIDSSLEKIDVSLPYNLTLNGSETKLASGLSMTIQDNRVQLTATGIDGDVTVQTSAILKEQVQLNIKDLMSSVNVTCSPK